MKAIFNRVSFHSVVKSTRKFIGLKSLSINTPFPATQIEEEGGGCVVDNRFLFKWKVKLGNKRVDSFIFLSPNSIYRCNTSTNNSNENVQDGKEENMGLTKKKFHIAYKCLFDATLRFGIMSYVFPTAFPLLEKVSFTDSAKMGTVSLNAAKIDEMRKWPLSHSQTFEKKLNFGIPNLSRVGFCYILVLELPVSTYVMKGVTLFLIKMDHLPDEHDSFLDLVEDVDVLEDNEEESAYNEALMEILKKHRGSIKRYFHRL